LAPFAGAGDQPLPGAVKVFAAPDECGSAARGAAERLAVRPRGPATLRRL